MSIALQKQRKMPETQRRRKSEIGIDGPTLVAGSPPRNEIECSSPSASSSSSSSSIGKNSDCEAAGEEKEVQSPYLGGGGGKSLDLGALEQTLPHPDLHKGGLSKCYAGKARSFSDLGNAESISNISEIQKKEHALNKRRRNQIALKHVLDRSSCRSALSLATSAARLTIQDSNSTVDFRHHSQHHHHHHNNSYLPPLYPAGSSTHHKLTSSPSPTPMRSFSMADLHYFSAAAASTNYL
ncbi:Protein OXIDATIVE STRESS 3 LIKE 1 [Linum grandiflorum]